MQENVKVLQVKDNSRVLVAPVFGLLCAECSTKSCYRQKYAFWVNNRQGLKVQPGDFVRIKRSGLVTGLEGVFALLLPVLCCFCGAWFAKNCSFALFVKLTEDFACFWGAISGFAFGVFADLVLGFILSFVFSAYIAEVKR